MLLFFYLPILVIEALGIGFEPINVFTRTILETAYLTNG